MQPTLSGFRKAPISKSILSIVALTSLITSATRGISMVSFSFDNVISKLQLWRVLSFQLCFTSAGDLCIGLALMYQFRLFERQWGSRKFGSFLIFAFILSSITAFAPMLLKGKTGEFPENILPNGPYSLIFSFLVQWFFEIPASHSMKIVGIPISDKTFVYLLALQLATATPPASFVAAIVGCLTGFFYRAKAVRKILVPKAVCSLCSKVLLPLIEPGDGQYFPQPTQHERNVAAMLQNLAAQQRGAQPLRRPAEGIHYRGAQPPAQRVTEAQLETHMQVLLGMGFTDVNRNQRLLMQHGGNVQRVLDELLH